MVSNAPYLAAMDGDMQHDETVLPEMLRRLRTGDVDLVAGTRHREGGSMGELAWARGALSQLGRRLSALVCHADVSDPMSGFFALRRDYLDEVVRRLSCVGFKILVDLLPPPNARFASRKLVTRFASASTGKASSTSSWGSNTWSCCCTSWSANGFRSATLCSA